MKSRRSKSPKAGHSNFRRQLWIVDCPVTGKCRLLTERRCYAFARQPGNGRARVPRRRASLWALPGTRRRLGGLGTNPECAVKSTDGFLTSVSRIQVKRCRGRPPRGPAREADQRATSKVMLAVRINGYEISYPVLGNDKHHLSRIREPKISLRSPRAVRWSVVGQLV